MPKPKEDPQDVLIVQNIDLNCDDVDTEEGWSHKDYYQVKWGGNPIRIKPGETRRLPRYVAEHFAKHLANHILMKMEKETGKQFLVNNPIERPKVLKQIIIGVDQYFLDQEIAEQTEGEKVAAEIEKLNEPEEKALDVGAVPNPAIGELKEEPKTPEIPEEKPSKEKTSIWDPKLPDPSINELRHACKLQGIEFTLKDNKETLIQKLKSF